MLLNVFPWSVIPITEQQDTVGPITRSVTDAAILLSIVAGPDPADNFTFSQPLPVPDYTKALNTSALQGKRIGVVRLDEYLTQNDPNVDVAFNESIRTIQRLRATAVDPVVIPSLAEILDSQNETLVTTVDFKV